MGPWKLSGSTGSWLQVVPLIGSLPKTWQEACVLLILVYYYLHLGVDARQQHHFPHKSIARKLHLAFLKPRRRKHH